MNRHNYKRWILVRRILTYIGMTLLVFVIVSSVVLFLLGYRLNLNSGQIEQGALMQFGFSSLEASLKFTNLQVKNIFDTSAGFLDDVRVGENDASGNPVKQEIKMRENKFWTFDAMGNINQRYGSSTIQLGTLDKEKVGTKIAFTRIPEKEEFSE